MNARPPPGGPSFLDQHLARVHDAGRSRMVAAFFGAQPDPTKLALPRREPSRANGSG